MAHGVPHNLKVSRFRVQLLDNIAPWLVDRHDTELVEVLAILTPAADVITAQRQVDLVK